MSIHILTGGVLSQRKPEIAVLWSETDNTEFRAPAGINPQDVTWIMETEVTMNTEETTETIIVSEYQETDNTIINTNVE